MRGWLVVNGFINSEKFNELYYFLSSAAKKHDITLEKKSSDCFATPIGDKICADNRPDFVLFWDKDIHLARRLEDEGLRLFNSADSIEICDNKIFTAKSLIGKLPIPRTVSAALVTTCTPCTRMPTP